jgi:hypothetical protein
MQIIDVSRCNETCGVFMEYIINYIYGLMQTKVYYGPKVKV